MIVRPLIPQQSTVNGKRKVISRYEEGGEAKGIGGFFQKLLSDPTLIETAQAEQITPQTAEKIAKQALDKNGEILDYHLTYASILSYNGKKQQRLK